MGGLIRPDESPVYAAVGGGPPKAAKVKKGDVNKKMKSLAKKISELEVKRNASHAKVLAGERPVGDLTALTGEIKTLKTVLEEARLELSRLKDPKRHQKAAGKTLQAVIPEFEARLDALAKGSEKLGADPEKELLRDKKAINTHLANGIQNTKERGDKFLSAASKFKEFAEKYPSSPHVEELREKMRAIANEEGGVLALTKTEITLFVDVTKALAERKQPQLSKKQGASFLEGVKKAGVAGFVTGFPIEAGLLRFAATLTKGQTKANLESITGGSVPAKPQPKRLKGRVKRWKEVRTIRRIAKDIGKDGKVQIGLAGKVLSEVSAQGNWDSISQRSEKLETFIIENQGQLQKLRRRTASLGKDGMTLEKVIQQQEAILASLHDAELAVKSYVSPTYVRASTLRQEITQCVAQALNDEKVAGHQLYTAHQKLQELRGTTVSAGVRSPEVNAMIEAAETAIDSAKGSLRLTVDKQAMRDKLIGAFTEDKFKKACRGTKHDTERIGIILSKGITEAMYFPEGKEQEKNIQDVMLLAEMIQHYDPERWKSVCVGPMGDMFQAFQEWQGEGFAIRSKAMGSFIRANEHCVMAERDKGLAAIHLIKAHDEQLTLWQLWKDQENTIMGDVLWGKSCAATNEVLGRKGLLKLTNKEETAKKEYVKLSLQLTELGVQIQAAKPATDKKAKRSLAKLEKQQRTSKKKLGGEVAKLVHVPGKEIALAHIAGSASSYIAKDILGRLTMSMVPVDQLSILGGLVLKEEQGAIELPLLQLPPQLLKVPKEKTQRLAEVLDEIAMTETYHFEVVSKLSESVAWTEGGPKMTVFAALGEASAITAEEAEVFMQLAEQLKTSNQPIKEEFSSLQLPPAEGGENRGKVPWMEERIRSGQKEIASEKMPVVLRAFSSDEGQQHLMSMSTWAVHYPWISKALGRASQRDAGNNILETFSGKFGHPIDDCVIAPVQRIPRYNMLIPELAKSFSSEMVERGLLEQLSAPDGHGYLNRMGKAMNLRIPK